MKHWIGKWFAGPCAALALNPAVGAEPPAGDLYINHKYQFSIVKPDRWLTIDDYEGTAVLFLDEDRSMSVNVVAEDARVGSLEEYVRANVEHLVKEGFIEESRQQQHIDAMVRTRVEFSFDDQGEKVFILTDYYVIEGRGFHVTTSYSPGDDEAARRPGLDTLGSFRIL